MGSLFKRGDSRFWWIGFTDATGRRINKSTETEDRQVAEKLLAAIERRVEAERRAGLTAGVLTVQRYSEAWTKQRRERGLSCVDEDEDRLKHALPRLGRIPLKDVRRVHLRDLMRSLMAEKPEDRLAPRTILHVYGALRVMFADAVADELIPYSPCTLMQRRGELPRRVDADPQWRDLAVYSRGEVEQLISDTRIPMWRRVVWGALFLEGLRINEFTPRRWRDYDTATEPLGRLSVRTSYQVKLKREKSGTKTGGTRDVPVHPTFAKILATWHMSEWREYMGRHPQPDDLIVPSPYKSRATDARGILNSNSTLRRLHDDCETLGIRTRGQHDARRTFISLGIADGARRDILEWISHGRPNSGRKAFDGYVVLPWSALCAEIAHLRIDLLEGKVVSLSAGATPLLR